LFLQYIAYFELIFIFKISLALFIENSPVHRKFHFPELASLPVDEKVAALVFLICIKLNGHDKLPIKIGHFQYQIISGGKVIRTVRQGGEVYGAPS